MIYFDFKDIRLSKLGLGCMRLPLREDKSIDEDEVFAMVDYAIENGINYFDTAYPYHEGKSEIVIGKALKRYPRDSFYLADKYPGHQIASEYHPDEIFEKQLQKTGVDHFDFYLLHNVYENSINVYEDPKWGIIDYFAKQKEAGRIRFLGFSSHAKAENLERFLDRHPGLFDFCQIQLNYLDWTLQEAEKKVELLNKRNLPFMVMEPVRGGKLATLDDADLERLKQLRPDDTAVDWAFNFLLSKKGHAVILSGMSDMKQLKENIDTFNRNNPLNEKETELILQIAEKLKDSVPCTKCRYCTEGCPMSISIPEMIATYNEIKTMPSTNAIMWLDTVDEDKLPSACLGCGACASICPQNIDIPFIMKDMTRIIETIPSWKEISKQREEAAKRADQ
ncbi:MAG: aldo/keto reductase [Erysipelotrichaceae bacterium]|nr:aldo/keto reductase [Erysipelotrichaceae bacterium]